MRRQNAQVAFLLLVIFLCLLYFLTGKSSIISHWRQETVSSHVVNKKSSSKGKTVEKTLEVNDKTDRSAVSDATTSSARAIYHDIKTNPRLRQLFQDGAVQELLGKDGLDLYSRFESEPHRAASLIYPAQKVIRELSSCLLEKDLCGQGEEMKSSLYFDATRTPIHQALDRALLATSLSLDYDSNLEREVDVDALLAAIRVNNNNIPVLAAGILLRQERSTEMVQDILKSTAFLEGRPKAMVLQQLAETATIRAEKSLRDSFLHSVYGSLSNQNDRHTALEIQSKLHSYQLTAQEFRHAVSRSCHLGKDSSGENLWPRMRKSLQSQAERLNLNINIDALCG